ncbi:MAG: lipoate--protein ligase family protein, partial [Vallitaleaceae bacterium]|nr:lipoate--protein ligase family protein [Vallitaleaceae bacterium]
MYYYLSPSHNPYFNLATEEYFLSTLQEEIIYLYRNEPSIIIGRNQSAHAEINEDYVEANQIPIVRRLSGGGAVFHDLGNLNFCFITQVSSVHSPKSFEEFTQPIRKALQAIGILAEFSGRNDLLLDGKKISGNAQYHSHDKILHHGTLLFSSNMNDLS